MGPNPLYISTYHIIVLWKSQSVSWLDGGKIECLSQNILPWHVAVSDVPSSHLRALPIPHQANLLIIRPKRCQNCSTTSTICMSGVSLVIILLQSLSYLLR